MLVLNSWFFRFRYRKLPFIIDNICQTFQSDCREEIKKDVDGITSKFPSILTRLKLKEAKERMHVTYTPLVGNTVTLRQPIFTAQEVEKLKTNRKAYFFVLIILFIFESILYSFMGSMFIPKGIRKLFTGSAELVFGFAFALIFVAALHYAFKNLWTFLEAKHIIEIEKLDRKELKRFYPNLVLSLVILFLFLVANTYTGYIRSLIVEKGTSSSSEFLNMIHGPLLVLSILVTFVVALVMALLEKDIAEKSEKYRIYKNWYKQQKERKVYNTLIRDMLQSCNETIRLKIEKYWNLMKDIQRAAGREHDEKHTELYNELRNRIESNQINLSEIDDQTYRYFQPVAATCLALFTYGIVSDPMMQKTLSELQNTIDDIESFESTFTANADADDETAPSVIRQQNQNRGS